MTKNYIQTLFTDEHALVCPAVDVTTRRVLPLQEVRPDVNYPFIALNEFSEKLLGRLDANVKCYRNFLVEFDALNLTEQERFVEQEKKAPFSTKVFSGNKSYHYVFSLEEPVSAIEYAEIASFLVSAVFFPYADKTSVNPSRLTRFPGMINDSTGKVQELIQVNGRIPNRAFTQWLLGFQDKFNIRRRIKRKGDLLRANIKPLDISEINLSERLKKLISEFELGGGARSRHDALKLAVVELTGKGVQPGQIIELLEPVEKGLGISGRGDLEALVNWASENLIS